MAWNDLEPMDKKEVIADGCAVVLAVAFVAIAAVILSALGVDLISFTRVDASP